MHRLPTLLLTAAALIILASCDGKGDGVMSKGKMEDVLFDYHLAQAMTFNLRSDQRDLSDQYIAAVFKKHGVTEAEFDSSLVYYNRHQDQMADIYKNLQRRYERLDATLQYTTGNHEMQTAYTATGDTAEIWTAQPLFILRPIPTANIQTFTLRADTAFYMRDKFRLSAEVSFIREDPNDQDVHVVTAISITYTDNSNTSLTREQSYPGTFELNLTGSTDKEIKMVSGYFYYTTKASTRSFALVRNISLLRYHTIPSLERGNRMYEQGDSLMSADSLIADSTVQSALAADSATTRRHRPALNPDQKRKMTIDTLRDAKIIDAPAVRTPNSIGPSRRGVRRGGKP